MLPNDNSWVLLFSTQLNSTQLNLAFAIKLTTQFGLPWYSLVDSQPVHPWMLDRPVHGADGRLANHHGAPFWHLRSLEVQRGGSFYLTMVGTVFCIVCAALKVKRVVGVRFFRRP
jgi:hypothetical protein